MSHEREPEPKPAVCPGTGAIALAKAVEDIRKEIRLDPLSRITDENLDVRADPLQLDLDPAALWRELHRVAQEVPHDLLQPVGIAADRPPRRGQHGLEPRNAPRRRHLASGLAQKALTEVRHGKNRSGKRYAAVRPGYNRPAHEVAHF